MRRLARLLRGDVVQPALIWLVQLYIRLVYHSSRWTVGGGDIPLALQAAQQPFIVAFWHGRLLMLPLMWRRRAALHMLISGHRDGRVIAGAIAYFGIDSIAGSTSAGGAAALRSMVRRLRDGDCVGITPDGPDGPAMRVSVGLIAAARLSGVPIVAMTYATSRRRILNSWDRFHLALPLSRGAFLWGEPIHIPPTLDAEETERWRALVEERMIALTAEADRRVGREATAPGTLARAEWRARRRAARGRG